MPCPVCAWFNKNFPEQYKKWSDKDLDQVHDAASWYMLARINALEKTVVELHEEIVKQRGEERLP